PKLGRRYTVRPVAGSSNGRTPDSGSGSRGSSPCPAASGGPRSGGFYVAHVGDRRGTERPLSSGHRRTTGGNLGESRRVRYAGAQARAPWPPSSALDPYAPADGYARTRPATNPTRKTRESNSQAVEVPARWA